MRPQEQTARGIFGPRTAAQGHGELVLAWARGAKAQELWKNVHQVLSWYCHMRWQLLRTAVFLSLAGRVTWAKGIWANKTLEKNMLFVGARPPTRKLTGFVLAHKQNEQQVPSDDNLLRSLALHNIWQMVKKPLLGFCVRPKNQLHRLARTQAVSVQATLEVKLGTRSPRDRLLLAQSLLEPNHSLAMHKKPWRGHQTEPHRSGETVRKRYAVVKWDPALLRSDTVRRIVVEPSPCFSSSPVSLVKNGSISSRESPGEQ